MKSTGPSDKPCCAMCRICNADQQIAGMETTIRDRRDVLKLRGKVQLDKEFLLCNDHSHDLIPLCKIVSKVKQPILAVQSASLKTST